MKKPIILLLLLTSLFGYLEWPNNHGFLFQLEAEVLKKFWTSPMEALHPFTVLPLLGQFLLLFSFFQKTPNRWLVIAGMACVGILLLLLLFIGLLSMNWRIILGSLPFLVTAVVAIVEMRRLKTPDPSE